MDNQVDLTQARKYIIELAEEAGQTLKKYFVSGDFTQTSKGGVDFATQADYEVDAFLLEQIKKQYPQTNFLTEETAPADYSSLKDLDNLWVIDPLDGTINFSRKHPYFAISIGLVDKGVPKLGVVHIPMTGDTYWAQADQAGAFLKDKPIKVSSTDDLGTSTIACDWAWDVQKRLDVVSWLGKVSTHVRQVKAMGSAVTDLANLAGGQIDAYMNSGLKPWDVAASALLIEKAGGKITTSSGAKWDVFEPSMLATNGILHDRILGLLNK
jgi:myo-inositol-1(or 4)-monophosphatase